MYQFLLVDTYAHQNLLCKTYSVNFPFVFCMCSKLIVIVSPRCPYIFAIYCLFVGNHRYIGEISIRWNFLNMTRGVAVVPTNEFEAITDFLKTQV